MVGPQVVRFFAAHHLEVAFISATGLALSDGLKDPNPLEVEGKGMWCSRVEWIVRLLDHSNFGWRSLTPALPRKDINLRITTHRHPARFPARSPTQMSASKSSMPNG